MTLGVQVGLGPSDIVLDGDPAPPPVKRGATEEDDMDKFIASAYDFWLKKAPQILDLVDLAIVFLLWPL